VVVSMHYVLGWAYSVMVVCVQSGGSACRIKVSTQSDGGNADRWWECRMEVSMQSGGGNA
jgi:hypothetical protein